MKFVSRPLPICVNPRPSAVKNPCLHLPAKCVFIVKTLPFSPIREIFPRLFRPTPFFPNVYAGFLKSVFLISANFHFSTPLIPNNHGPLTRVRCERVLFFTPLCHNQHKTHDRVPANRHRAPPPMWSAATCRRFELGDMSPSPQAQRNTAFPGNHHPVPPSRPNSGTTFSTRLGAFRPPSVFICVHLW